MTQQKKDSGGGSGSSGQARNPQTASAYYIVWTASISAFYQVLSDTPSAAPHLSMVRYFILIFQYFNILVWCFTW